MEAENEGAGGGRNEWKEGNSTYDAPHTQPAHYTNKLNCSSYAEKMGKKERMKEEEEDSGRRAKENNT